MREKMYLFSQIWRYTITFLNSLVVSIVNAMYIVYSQLSIINATYATVVYLTISALVLCWFRGWLG